MSDRKRNVRIGKMDTLGGILKEMGAVYRLARRKDIDTLDANRLVSMLAEMRRVMEVSELEQRLRALEGDNVTPFRRAS